MNDYIEIYRRISVGRRPQWRWRYKRSGNHKVLAASSEGYTNLEDLIASLERVLGLAPVIRADVDDQIVDRNRNWAFGKLRVLIDR